MKNKLQQIFQSYLFARIQPLPKYENIDDILNRQQLATMMAHLPLKYLINIKQITNINKSVLSALFQNNLDYAKQAYTVADKIIKYNQFNQEAFLVVQNNLNASKGYFDYRQGDYKSARENLQIALKACIILVNKYDYNFLQGRPIHLTCNLVKVEACSGNKEKAIKIACYLISNIEGKHNGLLYDNINLIEPIQHLSFKNESFLLTQVFEEIAKLLASCQNQESNNLINLATNFLGEYNSSSNTQFYREYSWFKNKQTLAKGKIDDFLEESSKFLAEGRGSCKLLWHATVLDVLKICQNIDSEISRKLQKQIREDFANYKYLPSVLKV
ncbi:MAG: hypothetical protein ACRC06_03480 [Waterburya sp.]